MAAIKTICIVLMLVLPLFACACQVSVSQKLTKGKSSKTSTYTVTVRNVGDNAAANVILTASDNLDSISGMSEEDRDTYDLPNSVQRKGGIPAGSYYTFTYTVRKSQSVSFTASCVDSAVATQRPAATAAPTTAPKATKTPTTAATTKATTAPTKATTAPTKSATVAPTKSATSAPTTKGSATSKPSNPTSAPNTGSSTTFQKCPAGTWWQPDPLTTWQWQISGTVDTSFNVQVYDIDLFAASTTLINTLHSQGKFVICYFSSQFEDWRSDASQFPKNLIGNALDDWEGENYVDSRSPVIRSIMTARLAQAAAKGCDAVEPDNVDSWSANNGFKLTSADGLDYNKFLADTAHSYGMSVGLKNDLAQVKSLVNYFDWALNEQCNQYSECDDLTPFITAGKAVFNAEYSGSSSSVCPKMNTAKFSTIFKDLDLKAPIKAQCCSSMSGGCKPAAYTCGGSSSKRSLSLEEDYVVEELDMESALTVEDLVQEVPAANSAATAVISASVLAAAVFVALL